ncbi:MAG TPA: transglycosylase SLT domain-containing protein [Candidatus Polarisedimenticolaceae bacterium]|nr:transglycosylase SLT domain-containing protein [Candidatus Polarisedimenticolaceae bacterium]
MKRKPWPTIGGALLAGLAWLAACDTTDRQRIERVLVDRAPWLDESARREIARAVTTVARSHEIDPWLLLAVIEVESTYRFDAHSRRGAVGLMQVKPLAATEVAEAVGAEWTSHSDLLVPARNVAVGAAYLVQLKRRFRTWDGALTAYNRGPGRAGAAGPVLTSRYAKRVLRVHASMLEQANGSP